MSCEYKKYINSLLNGDLSVAKTRELKEHAKHCDECKNELDKIEKADASIMQNFIEVPFTSSKDEIMEHIDDKSSRFHLLSVLYSTRKYTCTAAAILVLILSVNFRTPIYNGLQSAFASASKQAVSTDMPYDAEKNPYVKLDFKYGEKVNILKLYPSYIPKDMEILYRTIGTDGVSMYFRSTGNSDYRSIGILIDTKEIDLPDKLEGHNVSNGHGEWIFLVGKSPMSLKPDGLVNVRYNINDNVRVGIICIGISKDEILKIVNSIKETDEPLFVGVKDQARLSDSK